MLTPADCTAVLVVKDRDQHSSKFTSLSNSVGVENKIVDFYSKQISDLLFIAKHRVMFTPTLLVLNNNKVVARLAGLPDGADIDKLYWRIFGI